MIIGVPKEIKDHETRVGLVPSGVIARITTSWRASSSAPCAPARSATPSGRMSNAAAPG